MSETPEISASLRILINEQLFPLGGSFTNDTDLYAEGLDSMALMQLILLLEQKFGISLEAADLDRDNFATLNQLAALIANKQTN